MATLFTVPCTIQRPSEIRSACSGAVDGAGALRMFAGTSIDTVTFGFTSMTSRSRIGYGPFRWTMCVGNFTPAKSL